MATRLPYRDDEEQDAFQRQTPDGLTVEPMQENEPVREPARATEPSRVEAQRPVPEGAAPAAPKTFKQMQDAGEARPPMPPQQMGGADLLSQRMGGNQTVSQVGKSPALDENGDPIHRPPSAKTPGSPMLPPPAVAPPAIVEPETAFPPPIVEPPGAIVEPTEPIGLFPGEVEPIVEEAPSVGGIFPGEEAIVEPAEGGQEPINMSDWMVPEEEGGGSSIDFLNTLIGGAGGTELSGATEQAALDQLNNPSPFNAQAVKDIYGDLGAGIDADYDARIRGLDEGMASRGLFGSLGKDFHSGRLADTELGRRDAKTSMARDLAKQYATSYGDYNANAINQGQNVSSMNQGNSLDWLRAAMGFGQQGFENDLAVEQFNANQDADYQQLLQMMLAAGYGA